MIKTIFLIMITTSLSLASCKQNSEGSNGQETKPTQQTGKIERVDSEKFEAMLHEYPDAQLVDVRTAREYSSGHLEHAVNIDYNSPSFKNDISKLKKDQPVFVYCAVGGRSASASYILKEQGFTHIVDLGGGIADWKKRGKNLKQD
ncbi:rhodanese-like domain-containing protein [Fulvivirga sp. 29W222]|uniref:Rhodanese-like domain-containing protein n=1 Tax=Fulvivirga marina TaxID=2494733 RepID=A0A937G2A7_9BACT|nr:rhodanese-like domain-containing protein [Fulvivirga marina]MBL6448733.1 rhodanese-like domain-containing protein [Fulvivirga marina]